MFMDHINFKKHPFQNALVRRLSPYGLVLSEGELWKKHRVLISRGFEYVQVDRLLPRVMNISRTFVQSMQSSNQKEIANVFNFFKQAAGNIISLVYFQEDIASAEHNIEGKSMPVFLSDLIADLTN